MPNLNDIKNDKEIGYKGSGKHIWHACIDCGKEHWVTLVAGQPKNLRCRSCSKKGQLATLETRRKMSLAQRGEKNYKWNGGRIITNGGYVGIWLSPDDFFYPMMGKARYIFEHRLVMAKHLGRCLTSKELVHHLNGIKDDNRLENLALVTKYNHEGNTLMKQLQKRIRDLEQLHLVLGEN